MISLSTPIEKIPRIGPVSLKKLKRLGIRTINDMLFHFPYRYEDFSNLIPISELKINEICTVFGKVTEIKNTKTWKKRMMLTHIILEDKTGAVKAVWFNHPYIIKMVEKGDSIFLSGKLTIGKQGIYFSNPSYEKANEISNLKHTARLVPVYPETAGLSSRWFRYILKPLINEFGDKIVETLPEKIIKENNLLSVKEALWQIHFPDSFESVKKAKERFSFEELFFIELYVLKERSKIAKEKAVSFPFNLKLIKSFITSLSFKLTDAQKKSAFQILKDLEKERPMNRLLEGDVGSGKTVVAVLAALIVSKAKYQTAFMAPTEILAKQHFHNVSRFLKDFNLNIGLLTGKQDQFFSKKLKNQVIEISRRKILEKAKEGEIDILIGTHALIQEKVKFGKLALVILDEQHRFGVKQRAKLVLKDNQKIPHLLSMTATPIPRTLALTIYGDLDLSIIDELPKGRKKVITEIVSPNERFKTYKFITKEVKKGRQVFVICPRIEAKNNEKSLNWAEVKAVKEEYEKLSKDIFKDLKVSMLHGKMALKEKEKVMIDFKNKKTDILVSTSVVEVGVDIPNATVMMIEGAERFGLAQLHQFRGRVGRAGYQSYCFLFTESPAIKTQQRLRALISCENGFALAERDLEIRGPGNFSGTRQWGIPDLMMNSLKDISLVEKTRELAKQILIEDPQLKKYPVLKIRVNKLEKKVHLE
ncbi:MAG: ATP-dependent DNA helicase RecG [Candidatus Pacebacteria bacterium]|nr:ATP-dependent DNA helicase RecG [Candidatus Paceibacterota bacterium]